MGIKPAKVTHLVLLIRDVERSKPFYQDVLGPHVTVKMSGRMVFLSSQDDASHELALMALGEDATEPDPKGVGIIYHFS